MLQSTQKRFLALVTIIAALGGFLFGFDMAVVSGIIEPVKNQFSLSAASEGWFVSSALLGCIAGVAFSGSLSDAIGRKKVLFLAAILFLISAIGFSFSENYSILISFRVLAGMAVGVASNISPLYISEIAPARNRGALVTFYQLAITIGILVAYLSNYFIQLSISQNSSSLLAGYFPGEAWRLMFFVSAIPATLFLFLLLVVPESPRWLMKQGRESASLSVLSKIHDPEEANKELLSIKKITASNNSGKIHLTKKPMATILILVMALTALSQFSGINGVIFYGPTILHSAGIVTQDALLYQVMLGAANMLFTLIAIWKVDSWGRRPLYIYGSLFAGIALALTGLCFAFDIKGYILLSCMMLFLLFFAFSLGPLKFVLATEFFPTEVRGKALSICILTMWVADWLVNLLFPVLRENLGIAATFFLFAFFCLVSFYISKKYLPETKGKSLEEIGQSLLSHR